VALDTDINAQDKAGRISAHTSIQNASFVALSALLSVPGIDLSEHDGKFTTVLDGAVNGGHMEADALVPTNDYTLAAA
jgi:hypothetical protein